MSVDLDVLCIIAVQSKGKEHHQSIDGIVKESPNGIYVAYCNALCKPISDGRSAFFGNDYNDGFSEFKDAGLTKNDGIDRRVIEMPSFAGCLIVECDLANKKVTFPNLDSERYLVKTNLPFVFENGELRKLTLEEIKTRTEKALQEKAEYQPSIPPVKTFEAKHIGRQADIAHLSEFLCNIQKHFLLLYGVGGMGKSHLLYCCLKHYKGKSFLYHAVSPNEHFTLNRLFEVCLLPKPDDGLSIDAKQLKFVEEFQKNNIHLIIDDYYEVQLEEVKSLFPKLIGVGIGKMLTL